MQKIVPFLWFDTEAEEAAKFYVSRLQEGLEDPQGLPLRRGRPGTRRAPSWSWIFSSTGSASRR